MAQVQAKAQAQTQRKRYPGIYAAMPTPLTADRVVDGAAINRIVGNLLDNGIDGLSILGSTGECSALSRTQRQETLALVLEAAGERGTVFTGAAGTVVDDVIADLKAAGGTGAQGALVPPPFYYPIGTDGVVDFYERVAEASPVPIILYHIPRMTKVPIALEAVARLAAHPNIMGIKDSSGEFGYFSEIARIGQEHPDFTVYTGSDGMLAASLFVGGHGVIGAGVNVVPDILAAVYRAAQSGDRARAMELQRRVADAVAACRIGTFPAAYKAQFALKGLCDPYTARPVPPLNDGEMAALRAKLVELGVLSAE